MNLQMIFTTIKHPMEAVARKGPTISHLNQATQQRSKVRECEESGNRRDHNLENRSKRENDATDAR